MKSVAVPAFLVAVALLDAALAGFRAAAGRSALIRKARYNLAAAARGTACSCLLLLGLAIGYVAVVLVSLAGLLHAPAAG